MQLFWGSLFVGYVPNPSGSYKSLLIRAWSVPQTFFEEGILSLFYANALLGSLVIEPTYLAQVREATF